LNKLSLKAAESGLIPDFFLRKGIRSLLRARLREINSASTSEHEAKLHWFIRAMQLSPIAESPEKANEQHYELPPEFFLYSLGENLKYSCGYWPEGCDSLTESEVAALAITFERAELQDGKSILELGCGWGSLSLYMAERLPNSRITSVSNSLPQAQFIRARAEERGLTNLSVITADMNDFTSTDTFDRIVSVEMFEHMRNWHALLERIANCLSPGGLLFIHIFTHKDTPYFFEDKDDSDWMSRHFFTGGLMPSAQLPSFFSEHMMVEQSWQWNGQHYQKTSNAWLAKMDSKRQILFPYFKATYGDKEAKRWWQRWRLFYMACAELFGYNDGTEWMVSHYRFSKR
jgi:cyclopropane-fatty-acyl-phospholipid synthase